MLSNKFYISVIERLHDGLYFVDNNRIVTYWNKAAEIISGFTAEEVIGHSCSENILTHIDKDGNHLCNTLCPLAASMKDLQQREAEFYMHHKDGHRILVSIRVNPMIDDAGEIIGGFELFSDISNQQANELRVKELEKLAYLDHLTQLSNRGYLEKELLARLNEFSRYGVKFGLLFIDIDKFKTINDTCGHDTGDDVLKYLAKTFTANCRPFDLYGRWGGEEFIGIIRNINRDQLNIYGNRIRQLVENSYIMHNDQKLSVTISLGGTIVCANDDTKSIISRSDSLLSKSKASGRNTLTIG